jgi:3-oxoacyl-[acyl-carrier protein] reductase
MLREIKGQVALVTGASRGIGRATALRLAHAGVSVSLVAKTPSDLEALAEEIRGLGVRAEAIPCDLIDQNQLGTLAAEHRKRLGRLDLLVNNAGAAEFKNVADSTRGDLDWVLNLNLRALVVLTQDCLPMLLESQGRTIINISSMAGIFPSPSLAIYSAAKSGVISWSRALFEELRRQQVKVSCICPGRVDNLNHWDKHGLRSEDVAEAIIYAYRSSERACPTVLYLQEQLDPGWTE